MAAAAELLSLSYTGENGNFAITNGVKKASISTKGTNTISTPSKPFKGALMTDVVPLKALCDFYNVNFKFDKAKNVVTLYGATQTDTTVKQDQESGTIELMKDHVYSYNNKSNILTDLVTGKEIGDIPITYYDKKSDTYLWVQKSTLENEAALWQYDKNFNKTKICDGIVVIRQDGYAYVHDYVNYPRRATGITTLIKVDLTGHSNNKIYKIKSDVGTDMMEYNGEIYFGDLPAGPDKPEVYKSTGTDKVHVTSGNAIFRSGNILYVEKYRKVAVDYKIDTYMYNLDTKKETKIITESDFSSELQDNGDLCYVKGGSLYRYSKGKHELIGTVGKMEYIKHFTEDEQYYYFSCYSRAHKKSYLMKVNKKDHKVTKLAICFASNTGNTLIHNILFTEDRIYIEFFETVCVLDRKTEKAINVYPQYRELFKYQ